MGTRNIPPYINTASLGAVMQWEERPDFNGLKFFGWYDAPTGGNEIKETTQFTGSKTVYAHWDGWFIDQGTNTLVVAGSAAVGPYDVSRFQDISSPHGDIFHSSAPWGVAMIYRTVKNIQIIGDVTEIGKYAFLGGNDLLNSADSYPSIPASVSMPASVARIGDNVFKGCPLNIINFDGPQAQWNAMYRGSDSIPANVIVKCTDGDLTPP